MNEVASESLQIVGEELAATIADARLALEQFAEGEGGPQVLDRCMQLLHTARGVLRMTETYGASLLAEEMEETCAFLARSRGDSREEAIDALSRAAVQLPAYVERILRGGRDIPLVLLPLLNDLRASRGKPLLSESTLLLLNVFAPATEETPPADREASGEDLVALARELRPRFQLALLGWIRGTDGDRNLRHMGEIAERLEQAATATEIHRLWWIVAGVSESLLNESLESSVSLKRLMGQADREMKQLMTTGEERYAAQPPRELINNLLYYIARVQEPGPRVAAIREAFRLADLVPGTEQVEAVRESLAAPSARLMQTVAEAIRGDLARVKDVLDIFVRTGMQHVEELSPQVELLKKIGDTLGVLGLGELREIVNSRREELQGIIEQPGETQEARFVEMAAALLSVEHRLDEQLLGLIAPEPGEPAAEETPDEVEFAEVSRAVMRECIVNLARVKDAVTQVLERPDEGAALDNVPSQLRGITAGLLILDKPQSVDVVEDIGSGINQLIQQGYAVTDRQRVDLLADAIVSLDYYLETLEAGRREPIYMLENAHRCIAAMHELGKKAVPEVAETLGSMDTTLQLSEPSATVAALDPRALATAAPLPDAGAGEDRPDPEIIELFIEEAREEIEAISRNLPAWQESPADSDALISVRRSFHTLKGSGRMVGAMLIGEFSWSIENLLNRVINKTLDTNDEILALLNEAVDALPQLLEQLEVGSPVTADISRLMETAAALAEGRVAAEAAAEPEVADTETPEEEEVAAAPEVIAADESLTIDEAEAVEEESAAEEVEPVAAGMDPVLLDILTKEVDTHVATIREFIDESRHGTPPFAIPEALYRSCHTLHGSVTMAKAEQAAALTGPLNLLIRRAFDHDVPVEQAVLDACNDSADALEGVMQAITTDSPWPDTADLRARLTGLDEALQAKISELAAEEESGAEEAAAEPVEETPAEFEPAEFESEPEAAVEPEVVPYDAEIAGIFADEAAEILEGTDAALLRLGGDEAEAPILEEMQRYLHTLKGGARMAGLAAMGDLAHDFEALLIGLNSGRLQLHDALRELLQSSVDELHRMRDHVVAGAVPSLPDELSVRLQTALAGEPMVEVAAAEPAEEIEPVAALPAEGEPAPEEEVAPEEAVAEPEDVAEPEAEAPPMEEAAAEEPATEEEEPAEAPPLTGTPALAALNQIGELARELAAPVKPAPGGLGDLVPGREAPVPERRQFARVDPGTLEQLLNNAGEISIFHSRLAQQMTQIQFNLEELGQTVVRLKEQLRSLELATEAQILYLHQSDIAKDERFDPLELDRYSRIQQLSRALAETASDVNSLKDLLQNLTSDTEGMLAQQSRTANELQDGLMRTRMVPFQEHGARLARLVRQTAAEHDRKAELYLQGGGELDRQVLEKMLAPFEHMLRNAVIHGIEDPAEREAAGKPATGTVTIALRREGSEVVIEVADDGRGLDIPGIRQKAIEHGLLDPEAEITDEETIQLILRSGFSTADQLTQSAGRGIGMDVVASEIAKLGGTLRIDSQVGQGTAFTVRLPFTLAVTQALIVRSGHELFALPLPTVEGIIRISMADFDKHMAAEDPAVEYAGQMYHFRHLGQFVGLGPSRIAPEEDRVSIILVRAGDNSTALITDELLDSREIVVKPVGEQLATIRGLAGATILGDGRVVVILDVGALVRTARPTLEPVEPVQQPETPVQPLALVVDDSITMRRVTQRLLERNDFQVITAKDGVEAVSVLKDHLPDIILLDVEMPRMDGYEFAKHVRNNRDTVNLPIIMITSRVSEKHRARAIELGVNDYLGKPYQEQELLQAVSKLLENAEA
ncbi:MAG: Hpt domain-containing protein [Gammaproteobacteria bacterium]|nr:Hpt domain-containing protein [Gammaproteobacteria bacterium]